MVLLDRVLRWDAASIAGEADSHRAPGNPLRRDGRLGVLCGVEYAAQVMAVHGALTSDGGRPRSGMLASVRNLAWDADRLDLLPGPLSVAAELLHGEGGRMIYAFVLTHEGARVLEGRAAVVLGP